MPTSGSVSYTTCSGNFYDDGGPNGDYMISQHSVVTLYPATPGAKLSVNFNSFHTTANADFLYVYNGNDTSAPRIATLTGPSGFGTIRSSATDGSLTFKFISDNIDTYADEAGWAATISCSSAAPDTVTMLASGSFTTCGGYFYDGGGPNGDYMISQHSVVTLYPATPGAKLSVNFNSFHTTANADFLYVYNGNDTSAPRIATLTGPS
ncbi:MAG TPA: CUB domain-containing protein, partial [Chitinophagaceae bacterium]|nr:CUB domain-containing protein [Chitinophagaceae bacterium]